MEVILRQLLLFSSSGENFGLFIEDLEIILEVGQIFSVPKTPDVVWGIINHRGRIITVLDFGRLFGLQRSEINSLSRIVVLATEEVQIAFLVGNVFDFMSISEEQLMNIPQHTPGVQDERLVAFLIERDGRLISVLDTKAVLKIIVEMSL